MAKKKESIYKNWDEVNTALRELGEKKISLEQVEGEQTIKINQVKECYKLQGDDLKKEIKEIEDNITLFSESNKDVFLKDRTKKLTFGNISYRLTERLLVKNVKACIAAIKTLNLSEYLRVKEEVDKEAIKGLDDATLIKLGIERKKADKINIEPNYEDLKANA